MHIYYLEVVIYTRACSSTLTRQEISLTLHGSDSWKHVVAGLSLSLRSAAPLYTLFVSRSAAEVASAITN